MDIPTPYFPPNWPLPQEPIHRHLTKAFAAQTKIGWDQFFRGRIAMAWKSAIHAYYIERQPGDTFTPINGCAPPLTLFGNLH
jgi:hypothetical protein